MKFETLQENLNKSLSLVTRAISPKPQLPILSHLLLQLTNDQFRLIGSNLETTFSVPVPGKILQEGLFTVPARTFQELISSLPPEKITLESKDGALLISCGHFTGKINGTPGTDYPNLLLDYKSSSSWQFLRSELLSAINKTAYCTALDESRATLTGVLFKPRDKDFVLAATDGFRLSVVKLLKGDQLDGKAKTEPIILPARTLLEVAKILSEKPVKNDSKNSSPHLKVYFLENNQAVFLVDEVVIYSRIIAGNFPDFEKIIPPETTLKIKLSAEELLKTIRAAAIFARDSANIVKLKISDQKMFVSANAAQVGEDESEIDLEVEKGTADGFQIAFNYRYLLDFLSNLDRIGEVTLDLTSPTSASVFRSQSDPNFLHLIMPVRVQA